MDCKKYKILSGSALKLIAVITMFIDHLGVAMFSENQIPLFQVFGKQFSLYFIMRMIGRMAFPIYAFLLTEGFIHTHDRKKYGINLLAFAVISQIPWNLLHSGKLLGNGSYNVFFTLFFAFLALCIIEKYKGNILLQLILLTVVLLIMLYGRMDYGVRGFLLVIVLYVIKDRQHLALPLGTAIFAGGVITLGVFAGFSTLLFYNGERGFVKGKFAKYFFYAFYPLHMLLLYFLRKKFIGY